MEKISILQCFCGNTQIVYFSGMKAATLNEIKQELTNLPSTRVLELCLRLGRFKKENKELKNKEEIRRLKVGAFDTFSYNIKFYEEK